MDSNDKETLYLSLLAEFAIILTIILIVFTFTGGWYKEVLFNSIECEDWEKISELLKDKYNAEIKSDKQKFEDKVSKWLLYCDD